AGVCHSDLHLADGDWPNLAAIMPRPLILGHEVIGRVVETGSSVTGLIKGDRVGVPWIHWSCGECEICREGNENLCPSQIVTGALVNGGFAEYTKAKASHSLKVPGTLKSEEAAPLFCAGVTVYRALKRAAIIPGQRVAVFGVGGLGHLAVQIAMSFGAEVIAVDVSDEKLEFASSLGVDHVLNAQSAAVVKEVRALGRVHAAVVTSGSKAAYDSAVSCVRQGGALVVVGLPAEPLTFSAVSLVGNEIRIIPSCVGTREDIREVLDLASGGKVRCTVSLRPLEEVNEVLDEMRRGQIAGRVVLTV
ncbi:MAG TPA: zinc-dependent alcohol dehydrogenase, partial [Blastocatellia bacterium]|nr:zinc-dependent alcohol dehydrogenase [Blastocatellia bacterium]